MQLKTKSLDCKIKVKGKYHMDDFIQEVMLRCMHVPSLTAVGLSVTEKMT